MSEALTYGPNVARQEVAPAIPERGGASHDPERALVLTVDRLIATLAEEKDVIMRRDSDELGALIARKSHLAVELARISLALQGAQLSDLAKEKLGAVQEAIGANRDTLRRHVDAVRSVHNLIDQVIADAESDGTYALTDFPGR